MRRGHNVLAILVTLLALMAGAGRTLAQEAAEAPAKAPASEEVRQFRYFSFMTDPHYNFMERGVLWIVRGHRGPRLRRYAGGPGARSRPRNREDAVRRYRDPQRS